MFSTLIDSESKRWKVDLVRSLFLPFEANTILNIPLSYNLPEDKIIWIGNKRGEFTVKSAYYIAFKVVDFVEVAECSNGDPRTPFWRKLWHLEVPAKIRIFAWKACMNALLTKLNLYKRGINTDVICPICDHGIETILHSLVFCDLARQVWGKWKDFPVNLRSNYLDIVDIALDFMAAGTLQDLELFFVTAWSL